MKASSPFYRHNENHALESHDFLAEELAVKFKEFDISRCETFRSAEAETNMTRYDLSSFEPGIADCGVWKML